MSKVRTLRTRKAPDGFEKIEPVLIELEQKMKDAVNESHEGKRRNQAQWPIFRIEHQQNRYIYELFYKKKAISRELYDWLVDQKYVNQQLVGKWRKPGYERLCCLKCIQPKDTNYGTTCICRVPSNQLHARGLIECTHCGCRGCASGDTNMTKTGEGGERGSKKQKGVDGGAVPGGGASSSSGAGGKVLFSAAMIRQGNKRSRVEEEEEEECIEIGDEEDIFKLPPDDDLNAQRDFSGNPPPLIFRNGEGSASKHRQTPQSLAKSCTTDCAGAVLASEVSPVSPINPLKKLESDSAQWNGTNTNSSLGAFIGSLAPPGEKPGDVTLGQGEYQAVFCIGACLEEGGEDEVDERQKDKLSSRTKSQPERYYIGTDHDDSSTSQQQKLSPKRAVFEIAETLGTLGDQSEIPIQGTFAGLSGVDGPVNLHTSGQIDESGISITSGRGGNNNKQDVSLPHMSGVVEESQLDDVPLTVLPCDDSFDAGEAGDGVEDEINNNRKGGVKGVGLVGSSSSAGKGGSMPSTNSRASQNRNTTLNHTLQEKPNSSARNRAMHRSPSKERALDRALGHLSARNSARKSPSPTKPRGRGGAGNKAPFNNNVNNVNNSNGISGIVVDNIVPKSSAFFAAAAGITKSQFANKQDKHDKQQHDPKESPTRTRGGRTYSRSPAPRERLNSGSGGGITTTAAITTRAGRGGNPVAHSVSSGGNLDLTGTGEPELRTSSRFLKIGASPSKQSTQSNQNSANDIASNNQNSGAVLFYSSHGNTRGTSGSKQPNHPTQLLPEDSLTLTESIGVQCDNLNAKAPVLSPGEVIVPQSTLTRMMESIQRLESRQKDVETLLQKSTEENNKLREENNRLKDLERENVDLKKRELKDLKELKELKESYNELKEFKELQLKEKEKEKVETDNEEVSPSRKRKSNKKVQQEMKQLEHNLAEKHKKEMSELKQEMSQKMESEITDAKRDQENLVQELELETELLKHELSLERERVVEVEDKLKHQQVKHQEEQSQQKKQRNEKQVSSSSSATDVTIDPKTIAPIHDNIDTNINSNNNSLPKNHSIGTVMGIPAPSFMMPEGALSAADITVHHLHNPADMLETGGAADGRFEGTTFTSGVVVSSSNANSSNSEAKKMGNNTKSNNKPPSGWGNSSSSSQTQSNTATAAPKRPSPTDSIASSSVQSSVHSSAPPRPKRRNSQNSDTSNSGNTSANTSKPTVPSDQPATNQCPSPTELLREWLVEPPIKLATGFSQDERDGAVFYGDTEVVLRRKPDTADQLEGRLVGENVFRKLEDVCKEVHRMEGIQG